MTNFLVGDDMGRSICAFRTQWQAKLLADEKKAEANAVMEAGAKEVCATPVFVCADVTEHGSTLKRLMNQLFALHGLGHMLCNHVIRGTILHTARPKGAN